jgi:hypothetical protein
MSARFGAGLGASSPPIVVCDDGVLIRGAACR